jgi:hypothetical protein
MLSRIITLNITAAFGPSPGIPRGKPARAKWISGGGSTGTPSRSAQTLEERRTYNGFVQLPLKVNRKPAAETGEPAAGDFQTGKWGGREWGKHRMVFPVAFFYGI